MKFIKDTKVKKIGVTNRQHSIFYCEKCNKNVEKPKREGIKAVTCGCKTSYENQIVNNFKIVKDFGGTRRKVLAECPYCKTNKEFLMQSILGNKIVSCGCQSARISAEKHTTHGECGTRLHKTWLTMKQRCVNDNLKGWSRYGGRGITVCEEWRSSFISFRDWALDNGYSDDLSIDRIDNDGNYEPSNCRWATDNIQARNTRRIQKNNTSGYRGVSYITDRNLYITTITVDRKVTRIGYSKNPKSCGIEYDMFVRKNNLEHTLNFSRDIVLKSSNDFTYTKSKGE